MGRGYPADLWFERVTHHFIAKIQISHERRLSMKKIMITLLTVLFFAFSSNGLLFAADDSLGDLSTPEVIGDLLWVRPLGVMHTALGATAFVISLPVTIPLKKADEAKDFLITYPYYYFIKRPLREM
jgi:hypothetical protein